MSAKGLNFSKCWPNNKIVLYWKPCIMILTLLTLRPLKVLLNLRGEITDRTASFYNNDINTKDNIAADAKILTDHWIRLVNNISLHKSFMLHVHHVCIEGGRSGLVVPHLESVLQILGPNDRYLPNSTYPAAFRTFTDEEVLFLFGNDNYRPKWVSVFPKCMPNKM